ncbi:hypothetical protein [Methylobacterium sp. WL6]|uniref:hypothetical protein n=1 Tax=Methylobacterium sp. WL6 TaxID=2603901 RepID=UPI0011C8949F|nr:hypothetical protein [Methylobacterium sp. WL6]TXN72709.1 hypothetical protein FV230_04005 [Methylobacterium sp. WL6]
MEQQNQKIEESFALPSGEFISLNSYARAIEDFGVPQKHEISPVNIRGRTYISGKRFPSKINNMIRPSRGAPYMRAVLAAHLRAYGGSKPTVMRGAQPQVATNEKVVSLSPASTSADTKLHQKEFNLFGEFSPSQALAAYWVRGVESHRPKNINRSPQISVNINSQFQSEFAKEFKEYISMIGQQRRYSKLRQTEITVAGRMITVLQDDLCDKFQIIQDEASEFIKLLIQELSQSIKKGDSLMGAWGMLCVDEADNMHFALAEPEFTPSTGFTKSKKLR